MPKEDTFDIEFESDIFDMKERHSLDVPPEFFPGNLPFFSVDNLPATLDCSESDYHRIQAYSNTFGHNLIDKAPFYKGAWDGIEQTDPMRLGSGFECYFEVLYTAIKKGKFKSLDVHNFNVGAVLSRIAVMPDYSGKGSVAQKKDFVEAHPGKLIITDSQHEVIMTMLKSALSNQHFKMYLDGDWQQVILWIENGIPCKAMLDHVGNNFKSRMKYQPGDLKTTKGATEYEFEKSCYKYGYDMQAEHYTSALMHLYPEEEIAPFLWFVCETLYPYGTAIYEAGEQVMASGAARKKAAFALCRELFHSGEKGEFPKYTGAAPDGKQLIELPNWALNKSFKLEYEYEETD